MNLYWFTLFFSASLASPHCGLLGLALSSGPLMYLALYICLNMEQPDIFCNMYSDPENLEARHCYIFSLSISFQTNSFYFHCPLCKGLKDREDIRITYTNFRECSYCVGFVSSVTVLNKIKASRSQNITWSGEIGHQ